MALSPPTQPVAYAADTKRHLSPTPATPIAFSPGGRSRCPENLRGLRAVGWRGSLPLGGAVPARAAAGGGGAGGGRRVCRACVCGRGWEDGRGLPVTPTFPWDESPSNSLAPGP